jgi:hypothetical protein
MRLMRNQDLCNATMQWPTTLRLIQCTVDVLSRLILTCSQSVTCYTVSNVINCTSNQKRTLVCHAHRLLYRLHLRPPPYLKMIYPLPERHHVVIGGVTFWPTFTIVSSFQ